MLGAAEGGARWWMGTHPIPMPDPKAYYHHRLPAYSQSAYWSSDFVDEMHAIQWDERGGWWQPADFTGHYYQTQAGQRHVTGRPAQGAAVYLMGNSPAFDFSVPDAFTIASQLQALVPERRVFNLGANGNVVQGELARLKTLDLQPGDTVIFYDGTAEMYITWQQADDAGARFSPGLCTILARHVLALVDWACPQRSYMRADVIQPFARAVASTYRATIRQARAYTEQRGAQFIHAIQPHLYTRPLTAGEQAIAAAYDTLAPGEADVFAVIYPLLPQAGDTDLTHALDSLRDSTPVFVNCCHITERGDAVIAQKLYEAIADVRR